MAFTRALSTNKYGPCKLIVATDSAYGTHSTLAAAMADAVSGDTIFLRDSVTENVTLTAGVNITAWTGGSLNVPSITGTLTMTAAGTCNISGLRLVTNGAALIVVSGSAASILNVNDCYLSMGSTAITYSSSSSSSQINLIRCNGNLTTTGIKIYTMTSTGNLGISYCGFGNTGLSTTASDNSAGTVLISFSNLGGVIASTSTGGIAVTYSVISFASLNTTPITHGGTGSGQIYSCFLAGGSASALSVGTGATIIITLSQIFSSNTNAITGVGTVQYSGLSFPSTSSTINTTTQSFNGTLQGSRVSSPAAGFLGEQLSGSVASGSAINIPTATGVNIVTLSLTAGIWDVTALGCFGGTPTGGLGTSVSITETSATVGTVGVNALSVPTMPASTSNVCLSLAAVRIVKTSTSNVYMVQAAVFTGSTCSGFGKLTAVRVG